MAIPHDKGISGQIHQNKALANVSIAFKNTKLIAQELSPTFPVLKESDSYYVYDMDNLRLDETARANGAEANEVKFNVSTASYKLQEHALKDIVTDRDRANADEAINMDADTTENLTDKILLRIEEDLHELVMTKSNWSNNYSISATAVWSLNTTLADPIDLVATATTVVAKESGKDPNVMVVNYPTFIDMKINVNLIDRIKYTTPDSLSDQLIARLLDIDKLLVGKAIQNTADEGMASDNEFLWTDSAFIGYVEPAPGLKKASALQTYRSAAKGNPWRVKKWREEPREGDMIEVQTMYDHIIPASMCGFLVLNTQ